MKSEVELNQNALLVNDVLFYIDESNCQKWTIINLFDGGFEAKDDQETRDYFFSELQHGWVISEKTKEYNRQNYRTNFDRPQL